MNITIIITITFILLTLIDVFQPHLLMWLCVWLIYTYQHISTTFINIFINVVVLVVCVVTMFVTFGIRAFLFDPSPWSCFY